MEVRGWYQMFPIIISSDRLVALKLSGLADQKVPGTFLPLLPQF